MKKYFFYSREYYDVQEYTENDAKREARKLSFAYGVPVYVYGLLYTDGRREKYGFIYAARNGRKYKAADAPAVVPLDVLTAK